MLQLTIPDLGLLLLWQFCSDPNRGISPLFPICRNVWWTARVASGRFHSRVWCQEKWESSGEEGGLPNIMAKLNPKKATA
jgi:hypothetical protein